MWKNIYFRVLVYGVIIATPLVIVPNLITLYYKKKYKRLMDELEPKLCDTLWISICPDRNYACKEHIWKKRPCSDKCSYAYLTIILNHIKAAKESISMCMYCVTLWQVFEELVAAKRRGVAVRLITDSTMLEVHASTLGLGLLKRNKIPVKVQNNPRNLVHHKFCLFDENSVNRKMFNGSVNLTMQALTRNWEQMVFMNDPQTIKQLSEEFEYLWEDFKAS